MKNKIMIWSLVFMLSAFAGSALGGSEGASNTFYGLFAGSNTPNQQYNTFLGTYAGFSNTTGYSNIFLGYGAGYLNTTGSRNTFLGTDAGYRNIDGYRNTFLGNYAGFYNTSGFVNTFLGNYAGYSNITGYHNIFLGYAAGYLNTTGSLNTFFGNYAGYSNITGSQNTFLGDYAGFVNITGSHNTFLGQFAGYSETGSNKLYIDNCYSGGTDCTDPFIYGEFDNRLLKVDGSLGVGTTPVRQLHVAGSNAVFRMDRSADTAAFMLVRTDVSGNPLKTFVVGTNASGANTGEFVINDLGTAVGGVGTRRMTITNAGNVTFTGIVTAAAFFTPSSLALKTNVRTYENPLETVKRLRGVRFDWKDSGTPAVGLIAEEVEGVVPEVVAHGGNSGAATGVNYASLVAVLVEAVKEQQAAITKQQEAITQQQEAITQQQEINAELKAVYLLHGSSGNILPEAFPPELEVLTIPWLTGSYGRY